ncbi:hypothetical protein HU200_011619 [Digitaria exilis]|uniref:Uncharacterized protein n=1 Tax=Digitaria exilis TaxID=1010633 RepID=A0A835AA42_9POAL|nr:hypothetical protein HU200_058162 [Digitaria exilis]KAF8753590.1 hypothetical protein HU200_011619 [Digitaria exilis]
MPVFAVHQRGTGLLGGLTMFVTFSYPSSLAPGLGRRVGLRLLGTAFSLAFSLGGVWSIVNNVMKLKFFMLPN